MLSQHPCEDGFSHRQADGMAAMSKEAMEVSRLVTQGKEVMAFAYSCVASSHRACDGQQCAHLPSGLFRWGYFRGDTYNSF